MTPRERKVEAERLLLEMMPRLRGLQRKSGAPAQDAARGVGLVRAGLAAIAGCESPTAAQVERALRVVRGSRPENDDGARLAQLVRVVSVWRTKWQRLRDGSPERLIFYTRAMRVLREIDPAAFGRVGPDWLHVNLLVASMKDEAPTGTVADMLLDTGALGTSPRAKRAHVQRRVVMAARRHGVPMSRSK